MAYYNRFKVLLADYVDKPTIPTVVALLTCGACLVPRGMQSAGWIFCGIGYRMLTDIGCHIDVQTVALDSSNYRTSAIDLELRKRVYWGAYVGDMLQSLFLGGLPLCLKYMELYAESTLTLLKSWKSGSHISILRLSPWICTFHRTNRGPHTPSAPSRAFCGYATLWAE
ncbi:hypothetical protein K456DRAFT_40053 [Colletotrichum gloeosporioides 23]|nr:hypothetical protein K456DRAFT_40053 [Colletotrichum gloeosporioides 23]